MFPMPPLLPSCLPTCPPTPLSPSKDSNPGWIQQNDTNSLTVYNFDGPVKPVSSYLPVSPCLCRTRVCVRHNSNWSGPLIQSYCLLRTILYSSCRCQPPMYCRSLRSKDKKLHIVTPLFLFQEKPTCPRTRNRATKAAGSELEIHPHRQYFGAPPVKSKPDKCSS